MESEHRFSWHEGRVGAVRTELLSGYLEALPI